MQLLNPDLINVLILLFGISALILILVYTAFSSEETEEEEEE